MPCQTSFLHDKCCLESVTQSREPEINKISTNTCTKDIDTLKNKAKQNEFMKQYEKKRKFTTNETDKLKKGQRKKST